MKLDINNLENTLFDFVDQIKVIIAPETWENILLNFTKNEMLMLVLVYRKTDVNMTQIAEYLNVPLNTATGIVDRMEKKEMVTRLRSQEDKRVVTIVLTVSGKQQIYSILQKFLGYGQRIISSMTVEEIALIGTVIAKVTTLLQEVRLNEEHSTRPKVRKIMID